jgi:hypothetical protein
MRQAHAQPGLLPAVHGPLPTDNGQRTTTEKDLLPGLPRPPDAPASLYAPPAPPGSPPPLPGPYFEHDPRLDPEPLPPPGWFTDLEMGILAPHVKNQLTDMVQIRANPPDTVFVPSAPLSATVAPRIEVGYRLPSGFGEFVLGYQFLASNGCGELLIPDGPAALRSRLEIHTIDFDYASREWSLWPCWDMKWRFGGRLTSIFFDSRIAEPFDVAAAGSGIFPSGTDVFAARASNWFIGFGPHVGLELARRFDACGLALVGRVDGWISLGRLRQEFVEESTTLDANGMPLVGRTVERKVQAVPQLNGQVGVRWEPPAWHHVFFFAGYQYEYWWNVGRNSDTTSRGTVNDQGILLQAEVNF